MTLTLTIQGFDTLDNGEPARLRLDRHGAMLGRSPHADWSLPDPKNHVSSRHCEISFRDGVYLLADRSTNGTFVNGSADRIAALHPIRDGDRITIGRYEIIARMEDEGEASVVPAGTVRASVAEPSGWSDWDRAADGDAPAPSRWADDPAVSSPDMSRTAAPQVAPPLPDGGAWDMPAPVSRPSAWSSEPRERVPPSAADIWGQLASENEIEWSRGDFGPVPEESGAWGRVAVVREEPEAPAVRIPAEANVDPAAPLPAAVSGDDGWHAFVKATGLPAGNIRSTPVEVLSVAGAMLRQMVNGLVLMVEARARAKAQLGVQGTSLELDGNNPLKFIRSPERALLQMLEPPERGFMSAGRAVEDAYQDLQAHQMATLGAMRGALGETLARFAPAAIRERQGVRGWLARWLPGARDAALWRAYEHEFEGVVRGADEAFMDIFAKEFRLTYERHIAEMKGRRKSG